MLFFSPVLLGHRCLENHFPDIIVEIWHIVHLTHISLFLGRRGPHGIPLLVRLSVRPQEKFESLIYRHICLMNHLKTHQTNPMAPWDPLDAPLNPWDALPCLDPQGHCRPNL